MKKNFVRLKRSIKHGVIGLKKGWNEYEEISSLNVENTEEKSEISSYRKMMITLIVVFLIIVGLYGWVVYNEYIFEFKDMGTFGDSFGAINAALTSISLAGVIVMVFMQGRELSHAIKEYKTMARSQSGQQRISELTAILQAAKAMRKRGYDEADHSTNTIGRQIEEIVSEMIINSPEVTQKLMPIIEHNQFILDEKRPKHWEGVLTFWLSSTREVKLTKFSLNHDTGPIKPSVIPGGTLHGEKEFKLKVPEGTSIFTLHFQDTKYKHEWKQHIEIEIHEHPRIGPSINCKEPQLVKVYNPH
jgi:hypothetical protein